MSETSTVLNNVVDKLGSGADRLITDAEKFATEFIKRIDAVAPQIATELKNIGLYAWKCLVRQQLAEGIFYTLAGVTIPILMYLWFKIFVSRFFDKHDGFYDPWDGGLSILSALLLISSIIGTSVCLFYGITHLISPEYYAVEELLEKIIRIQNSR